METQYRTSSNISSVRDARLLHVLVTVAADVSVLVLAPSDVELVLPDGMLVASVGLGDAISIKCDQ